MAKYRLTSPTGEKFEVTAPDNASQDQVMEYFHANSSPKQAENQPESRETPGIGKTAFDQGMQGATFGFADEATDRIGALIAHAVTGKPYADLLKEARGSTKQDLSNEIKDNPVTSIVSNIAGGLLTGGAGSTTKAGTAIGNSLRTGNVAARVGKGALAGATSGAAYGAGTADEGERIQGAGQGFILGGTLGAAVPAVAASGKGLKNALIPKIEEKTKTLAQRARDFNIPLRADQISPSRSRKTLQKISQELPFSGVGKFEDAQRQSFNSAVAKTIGQESADLGPETINNFISDAGKKFSTAIGDQDIKFTPSDLNKIGDIVEDSKGKITDDLVKIVQNNVEKFLKDSEFEFGKGRSIPSQKLASLRSNILGDLPSIQSGAKQQVSKIIDLIDDVVEKQITPEQAEILKTARREWRNFKTIEPLLEKSTDGNINPVELLNRVKASKYIKASRSKVGEDDLVDLARIGKQFLPKQGGSDTFQKSLYAGSALGLTATANPILATKAATALGANRAYQGYNQSQKVIDLILNQIEKPQKALPNTRGVLTGNVSEKLR